MLSISVLVFILMEVVKNMYTYMYTYKLVGNILLLRNNHNINVDTNINITIDTHINDRLVSYSKLVCVSA